VVSAGQQVVELFHGARPDDCRGDTRVSYRERHREVGHRQAHALRWSDFDADAGTIAVTGKLVRQRGVGLTRIDETKTTAGRRIIPLPSFAVTVLNDRRKRPYIGQQQVIFASSSGTLRDPENFNTAWRAVRDELGMPDVTSHSFRKTVATLIDDAGLSARIGADHLGHAKVSMTQDRYMSRGRVHTQVADLLDRTVTDINDE
jgi:integrase